LPWACVWYADGTLIVEDSGGTVTSSAAYATYAGGGATIVADTGLTLDFDTTSQPGKSVITAVVVPEPSTFVLAALGLLGLIGFGRRRKR